MTMYNLTDLPRFFSFVLNCKGRVWYIDKRGESQDLKALARYALGTGMAERMGGIDRLEIQTEAADDFNRLLRYMINVGYTADFAPCGPLIIGQ